MRPDIYYGIEPQLVETEYLYHIDVAIGLNKAIKEAGYKIEDYYTPKINIVNNAVDALKLDNMLYYFYVYKPIPSYIFMYSPRLSDGFSCLSNPKMNGVLSKVANNIKTKDSISTLISFFSKWLYGIEKRENGFKIYEESFKMEPENINLNEDKPFSEKEIKYLEQHIQQAYSNAEEKLKSEPESEQKEIRQLLLEIKKSLDESIEDAKNKELTKPKWYEKYKEKVLTTIAIEILKGVGKKAFRWIMISLIVPIQATLINNTSIDLPALLEPKYHPVIPQIEQIIEPYQT